MNINLLIYIIFAVIGILGVIWLIRFVGNVVVLIWGILQKRVRNLIFFCLVGVGFFVYFWNVLP
ncbi:MAG TPA: hypothetical protein DGM69_01170 [Chloroflexi bacterium]|nr:hypothetical protein [Chloroflexota bacterium]